MLEIENFQYKIGRQKSPVFNLKISSNSLNIITGNNGEGKTLFFKSLCSKQSVSSGTFFWLGKNVDPGYLPIAYTAVNDYERFNLKVSEYFNYIEHLFNLDRKKIVELINLWKFGKQLKTKISNLSDGEKKRLIIIEAELLDMPIVLFDEPESSLDSKFRAQWLSYVKMISSKRVVFIATHFPDIYKNICHSLIDLQEDKVEVTSYNSVSENLEL